MPADARASVLQSTLAGHVAKHYARLERPISSLSLFGGFAFDALTLKRADTFWENFWVLAHLVLVAACILLIQRSEKRRGTAKDPGKTHFWMVSALQFLFGGLLSTFLVFYFRSGSFWVSWPFYLLLAAAFVANERLKKGFARLEFQISFFFLCLFCFAIFIVPVLVHGMGWAIFLLSGAISLGLLWVFQRALLAATGATLASGRALRISVATIFVAINLFYFFNLIPPLPLSLQDATVCHSIERTANGSYLVQTEAPGWFHFFRRTLKFHLGPGAPVYVYSAVFSPTALNTDVIHEWQIYDPKRGWTTINRVALAVRGGRGGGYRTYSRKNEMWPGAWRVNVETPGGAILGRIRFDVVGSSQQPNLATELKD